MRINGFYIDGFGIFNNQGIQDIPGGLVLFTGQNEGGKTTLMEFIRSILFGFPKGKKNDYQLSRGGNYGGRLKIAMQDGRFFTVERLGKRSTVIEDGNAVEQIEPSERLLIRIDRQTFERIFAVGLEDMQGLNVLSDEGICGRLFSASTGAPSVPSVMKQIDDEMDNLLKSRGKNPKINVLVKQLEEIESEIKNLQSQSTEYAELQRNLVDLESQIKQNKQESESISQRLSRIEALEKARNPWIELCEARKKVKELEKAQNFPPNGLERLEKLKEEIDEDLKRKGILDKKIERLDRQLEDIIVDQAIRSNIIDNQVIIRTLIKEREKLLSALNDLPGIRSETKQKEQDFHRKLKDLGTDWTSERLAETDTSIQIRNQVQDFSRKLNTAERHYEQLQADKRAAETAEKSARNTMEEAKEAFSKMPKPIIDNPEILKKRRESTRIMRTLFFNKGNANIQRYDKSRRLEEEKTRLIAIEKQMAKREESFPSWLPFTALAAGLVLAGISAIWNPYILTPIMALAGFGIMFWLNNLRKRQITRENARIDQIQEEKRQIEKVISNLNDEIEGFSTGISAINDELKKISQENSIDQPQDSKELDQIEAEIEEAGEKLRDWIEKKQKVDELANIWRKSQDRLKETEKEVDNAYDELQKLEKAWQDWIAERGFSKKTRPDEFGTILQMVENARTSERTLQESQNRFALIEKYIADTGNRIKEAMKVCNIEISGDNVGIAEIDALEQALNDSIKAKQKQEGLEQQLLDAKDEERQLDEKIVKKNTEKDRLLKQAGASDEEDFQRKAEDYKEWSDNTKKIEASNRALLAISGNIEAQENLENELAETEPYKLETEKDGLQNRLKIINEQISESNQKIGETNKKLNDMAHDERLSKLLLDQRRIKEELSDATRQWATSAITKHLLDQAREVYERERQPKVIQEATRFVEIMTNRPYRLVMPADDSKNIQLEDTKTLYRKSEINWSSGLADQVYLAIRLGLVQDFAQHEEPLPIILDDVLVRFDQERQLGAMKVILDMSRRHQVLMFTCQPNAHEITRKALESCNFQDDINVVYYNVSNGDIVRES